MKRPSNLFFWFLKQLIISAFFTTLMVFVSLQIYILIDPQLKITPGQVGIISGIFGMISVGMSVYFAYSGSKEMKKMLRNILKFVTSLKMGKYSEKMIVNENKEFSYIAEQLNELAHVYEEQVATMQRMASEKTHMHEQISAAAVLQERQRLARDLHDSVSQQLFALSMMSSATLKMLDSNPSRVKEQMEEIAAIAGKAQGEMRALLLHLRPIELSGESLADGIISLLKELQQKTDLIFEASVDDIEKVSKSVEDQLFRITQEALSNILRHAHASKIRLILTERDHHIYLYISDNGKGFTTAEHKKVSYGLKMMNERCEEIGGHFTVRSQKGKGTYIEIRVPHQKRERDE